MKKKNLLIFTLLPFLLAGCSKSSNDSSSEGSKEESSDYSSGEETGLPDAPVGEMNLSLANFTRLEVLPTPTITGLVAENIEIAYSYHNHETGARIGDYVAGAAAGSIELGQYKLKAAVTSSTYKPFELSADFSVVKATFPEFEMVAYDYVYNEVKPEPDFFYTSDSSKVEFPAGTVITYKYYYLSSDKHDYVPDTPNDIDSGNYTLEATISHPDYEEVVMDYDFVVTKIIPYSSSTGHRIVIGDYIGSSSNTLLHIDRSFFTQGEAVDLRFDFRNQSYQWSADSHATFTVPSVDSETAHINEQGKLVITNLAASRFTIDVGSNDQNYYINENVTVYLEDAPDTDRTIVFPYQDITATCFGLDETEVSYVGNGEAGGGNAYVVKLNANGSSFYVNSKFKAVKSVRAKFNFSGVEGESMSTAQFRVIAAKTGDCVDHVDDVVATAEVVDIEVDEETKHVVTSNGFIDMNYYDGRFVTYNFNTAEFEADTPYFLTFILPNIVNSTDGAVKVTELEIVYDAADFVPANAI